jgi:hypothetical protein
MINQCLKFNILRMLSYEWPAQQYAALIYIFIMALYKKAGSNQKKPWRQRKKRVVAYHLLPIQSMAKGMAGPGETDDEYDQDISSISNE